MNIINAWDLKQILLQELPITTYQDFSQQVFQKADFTEQEPKKHMIAEETSSQLHLERWE